MKSLVSRGADIASLGGIWQKHLPETVFAAPDGPFPFDQGGPGRQWFSIAGVTVDNRPQRVLEAREAFDHTIAGILGEHGFERNLERVALVGFSQGSIMALDSLASGRWPVAAVVAFAGRLAPPDPLTPSLNTRLLLVHGTNDGVIPPQESEWAEGRLAKAGVAVERRMIANLGHSISPEAAQLAQNYLAEILN